MSMVRDILFTSGEGVRRVASGVGVRRGKSGVIDIRFSSGAFGAGKR